MAKRYVPLYCSTRQENSRKNLDHEVSIGDLYGLSVHACLHEEGVLGEKLVGSCLVSPDVALHHASRPRTRGQQKFLGFFRRPCLDCKTRAPEKTKIRNKMWWVLKVKKLETAGLRTRCGEQKISLRL